MRYGECHELPPGHQALIKAAFVKVTVTHAGEQSAVELGFREYWSWFQS